MALTAGTRLILVDDVITSGKAIRESLEVLKTSGNPQIKGIVISVDR
jgi:orotate phosphoribosyltransferase